MNVTAKLDLIVLDCPDALALATFYGEVLGWSLEAGADRDWADLAPPEGGIAPDDPDGRAALAFQRIDDFVKPTCWPWAPASTHDHQPSQNDGFRVYLDPAGHPFCLVRA